MNVLVAGIGNIFLSDDGFGVEVVKHIDVTRLPEDVRKELQIVFVARISEVIDSALEVLVANPPPPVPASVAKRDAGSRQTEPTLEPIAVREA